MFEYIEDTIWVPYYKSNIDEWENMSDYQLGFSVVKNMKVVNDFAEKEVALIQNYKRRKSTIISDEINYSK